MAKIPFEFMKPRDYLYVFKSIGSFFLVSVVPLLLLFLTKLRTRKRPKTIIALDRCILYGSSLTIIETAGTQQIINNIKQSLDILLKTDDNQKTVLEIPLNEALTTLPFLVKIADYQPGLRAFSAGSNCAVTCRNIVEEIKEKGQAPLKARLEKELQLLEEYKRQKRRLRKKNLAVMAVYLTSSYLITSSFINDTYLTSFELALYGLSLLWFAFRFEPLYSVEIAGIRKKHQAEPGIK